MTVSVHKPQDRDLLQRSKDPELSVFIGKEIFESYIEKDSATRFSTLGFFFHESVSPKPLSILLGLF
jgi:hypothetical protein